MLVYLDFYSILQYTATSVRSVEHLLSVCLSVCLGSGTPPLFLILRFNGLPCWVFHTEIRM